jgi:hypothetical protein
MIIARIFGFYLKIQLFALLAVKKKTKMIQRCLTDDPASSDAGNKKKMIQRILFLFFSFFL